MSAAVSLRQIGRDLRSQKLRTLLTLFGIVWGTTAVSLLLAFGQGYHHQMHRTAAGLGRGIVIGWPSLTSMPFEGLGRGRRIRLTEEDVALVRSRAIGLGRISSEFAGSFQMQNGATTLSVPVSGVEPPFAEMRSLIPEAGGRFLNPIDMERRRRVVFLGNRLAREALGTDVEAVGRTVLLNGAPFTVIGVLQPKDQQSNYYGPDRNRAFIPSTTYRAMTGENHLDNFVFTASEIALTGPVKDQVAHILAEHKRFHPDDQEALATWDTTRSLQFIDTFMAAFRWFLGVVGSLTLVVGGIGVSNIMNVVVEERTREIGIKMALGARPRSVLRQLLAETLLISAVGGVLGLLLAAGICAIFPVFDLQETVGVPHISPAVAAISAALLGVIALVAGWFPARTASRLDPVVAMKV